MKAFIYYGKLMNIIPINIIFYLNAIKQLPRNDLTVGIGRYFTIVSADRGVGIALPVQRWATTRPGFDSQYGPEIFLYSTASKPTLRPPSLLFNEYLAVFPRG
jgi:hypothetical protein